ncbi:MAG: acyl-phosphate--glycerol-3-phosphate O-acyltransferase, partial [Candidatus Nealsonbacteria bacterium]
MIGWLILIALFAYFCGSFPAGYLIAKRKGVDIKKEGSGATGGTNVAR